MAPTPLATPLVRATKLKIAASPAIFVNSLGAATDRQDMKARTWLMALVLCGPTLPRSAHSQSAHDVACAPSRRDLCASFYGRLLWLSKDAGQSWRKLIAVDAPPEEAEEEEEEQSLIEQGEALPVYSSFADDEAEPEENGAELYEEGPDPKTVRPSPSAQTETEPEDEERRRLLCVSNRGVVALSAGRRVLLTTGSRLRAVRVAAQINGCAFDEADALWLSTTGGAIRIEPESGAWSFADRGPSEPGPSISNQLLGPYRAAARREALWCPVQSAALLPRIRLRFAALRAARSGVEAPDTREYGRDWSVVFGIWLELNLPGSRPLRCTLPQNKIDPLKTEQGPIPRPPSGPPHGGALGDVLDEWEQTQMRQAMALALGHGEIP